MQPAPAGVGCERIGGDSQSPQPHTQGGDQEWPRLFLHIRDFFYHFFLQKNIATFKSFTIIFSVFLFFINLHTCFGKGAKGTVR